MREVADTPFRKKRQWPDAGIARVTHVGTKSMPQNVIVDDIDMVVTTYVFGPEFPLDVSL